MARSRSPLAAQAMPRLSWTSVFFGSIRIEDAYARSHDGPSGVQNASLLFCAHCSTLRAECNLLNRINVICPVKSPLQKYFASRLTQITSLIRPVPSHRGALRNVINVGAGCGGR